jgi:hypothetical protein
LIPAADANRTLITYHSTVAAGLFRVERDGLPVHAYVVNMARSLDRRAHITRELEKTSVDYEIVTAVDGRELDMADAALIDPSFVASGVGRVRPEPPEHLPEDRRRRAGRGLDPGRRRPVAR